MEPRTLLVYSVRETLDLAVEKFSLQGGTDENTCGHLHLSGTTFFTLGLGDVTPLPGVARLLVVIEVALGFGFLSYLLSQPEK